MAVLPYLLPLLAYLIGSISFAYLAGKAKGVDLRSHGSGNLGATNAGRVLGGRWFLIVFLCDIAKGALPVAAAGALPTWLGLDLSPAAGQGVQIATGIGAILGHVFTLFHGFKGGKAVATSLGVLIGLTPLLAAACFATWLVAWLLGQVILRLRKSEAVGPASIVASIAAPAWWWLALCPEPLARDHRVVTTFVVLLALLVAIRHRSNVGRTLAILRERRNDTTTP
ncbi:MAG: glycerol-3-phosphate 1-O-acyltransferase PlsY [Planctomycetota bacterium]|jgi:glycerol-3-phosphate acyltransferase PlsY